MRELTFRGFLSQYVRQLSGEDTNSIYKLAAKASNNVRLREPLLLYAVYSGKQETLLQAVGSSTLQDVYQRMISLYDAEALTDLLKSGSPCIPGEYHKVWASYQYRKNRTQADNHTKELMRQKLMHLQARSGVSTYRIYTDLHLNPGNFNAWLKHGDSDKISLDSARKALKYVEATLPSR